MADKNRPSAGTPSARRRRPATVIDLEANEGAPEAAASPEPPPAPPPEPPPAAPEQPSPELGSAPPSRPSVTMPWSQIGAGLAGAAGGLLVVLLLWLGGVFSGARDTSSDLSQRLAAI